MLCSDRPGAHPTSYLLGTGIFLPRRNAAMALIDHSPPSRAESTNKWSYTSVPSLRLHGADKHKKLPLSLPLSYCSDSYLFFYCYFGFINFLFV